MFDAVRTACRSVAARSRFVRIDFERLPEYAASLPLERVVAPEIDPATHYLGRGEGTATFFVTLDAINFGSGYFPHFSKRPGHSGYFTVAASLADHFRAHGPIPAERLAEITTEECTAIFGQEAGNAPIRELMGLFARALNDLGRFVLARFDGSFADMIRAADGSAERLAGLLVQMPFYNDVERYGDLEVPFYKRAQLTAADLALAFDGEELGRFTDLDRLTIFADNLVPHVLRMDSVLRYAPDLASHIDREELIPAGSLEEVEIRACAVHAVELLAEELRRAGHPHVTAMGLDYLLWNRGQEPHYKKTKPRHRTRTVYY